MPNPLHNLPARFTPDLPPSPPQVNLLFKVKNHSKKPKIGFNMPLSGFFLHSLPPEPFYQKITKPKQFAKNKFEKINLHRKVQNY